MISAPRPPAFPAFFVRTGSLKRNHQHDQWRRKDEEESLECCGLGDEDGLAGLFLANDEYLLQTGCYTYWGR